MHKAQKYKNICLQLQAGVTIRKYTELSLTLKYISILFLIFLCHYLKSLTIFLPCQGKYHKGKNYGCLIYGCIPRVYKHKAHSQCSVNVVHRMVLKDNLGESDNTQTKGQLPELGPLKNYRNTEVATHLICCIVGKLRRKMVFNIWVGPWQICPVISSWYLESAGKLMAGSQLV